MKTLKLTIGLILAMVISIAGVTAQQQNPLPPKNFQVSVEETSSGPAVKITWTANEEGVAPNIYSIYSHFNDEEKLIMNAQIKADPNRNEYVYYIHNLHPGIHHFFMRAGLHQNGIVLESERTDAISIEIKGNNNTLFQFASTAPTNANIGGKYVYGMKVHSSYNCKIGFELVEGPQGMYIEGNNIIWIPTAVGEYKVLVRAFLVECDQDAVVEQSFVIRVTDGNNGQAFVKIMVPENGMINMNLGETITYQMRFESNINCPVLCEFQGDLPEGFHYEKNGIFVFSATKEGKYEFTVKAYLECQPDVHSLAKFVIVVGQGHQDPPKFCAYIKGMVNSEDNVPVTEGIVSAWKLDRNPNSNAKEMSLFKSEIKEGQYSINLPEGNYALDISGKTFEPEWYMDAEFVTDAERITVACEDEIEINAVVKMLPVPKTYTVTGKVYDAETNEPVYAQVEFIPVQNLFQDSKNTTGHSFITKTDENGNYTITLQDNHEYIARAISAMNSVKYMVIYYESATNPMEADIIELTGDLSDINFAMKKADEINKGGFTGIVINKDNGPLKAKLIAYCVRPSNQYFDKVNTVFTTESDEQGYFRFDRLIPGDYVVMSMPLDKNYVPGYYKQNDYAVLKWKDGTIISVDDAMIDIIYEIMHRERGDIGLVEIGGKIINSGGGKIVKQTEKSQSSIPVAGALIYVVDEFGTVSDYGYTNSLGEFNLQEVAVGNLKLIADKVGFDTYESQIQTDFEKNSNIQMEFAMSEAPVRVDESEVNIFDAMLYPTPAGKTVTLEFTSNEQNQARISFVNSMGLEVYRINFDAVKGDNISRINTSNLVSGTYFVRLTIGNVTHTLPLQVVR
ncbi:MAG: T9SS type A sorting domain-containing protein [bacterium]